MYCEAIIDLFFILFQSLFVRWILLVYDYLDKTEKLHKLYGIIFFFLESQILVSFIICNMLVFLIFILLYIVDLIVYTDSDILVC